MRIKHLSYAAGAGTKPLQGITVGDLLRQAAKRHPHSLALIANH